MRRLLIATGMGISLLPLGMVASVPASSAAAEKVSYSHRTGSDSNPYAEHSTDADSIVKAGHGDHTGPVFSGENWRDIIPPFDHNDGASNFTTTEPPIFLD